MHRDVKPPNILFRRDGTPVLGDFGICHMEGDARVTLSDEAMGSTNYIAPEMQAGQHGLVTGAADVYALGKVLYRMLSSGRIFAREDHRIPGCYLPQLLGDQRWWHFHEVLLSAASCQGPVIISTSTAIGRVPGIASTISSNHFPVQPG